MFGILAAAVVLQHPEWGPAPPAAPMDLNPMPSAKVVCPIIFPLAGPCRWSDDFNDIRGSFRHSGIDIKANKFTPIVAPFRGKLGMKEDSFWIYGDNGWICLGTHLNDEKFDSRAKSDDRDFMFAPNMAPYMTVEEGELIGYVGESGDATGYHLHFELYAPGEGETTARIRNPYPSLKTAQFIKAPRPYLDRKDDLPPHGQMRLEGCIRKADPTGGTITIILLARQTPDGRAEALTYPTYRKVKLNSDQVDQLGGWDMVSEIPRSLPVSLYISALNPVEPIPATRVAWSEDQHPERAGTR